MKTIDYINLVNDLNEDLDIECYENGICYRYSTNGYVDIIYIGDYELYNSEIHSELDIEECGDFKSFILMRIKEYKKLINSL